MSHLLHVFPLISLHELTPVTDAYQWNAHDHLEYQMIHHDFATAETFTSGCYHFAERNDEKQAKPSTSELTDNNNDMHIHKQKIYRA